MSGMNRASLALGLLAMLLACPADDQSGETGASTASGTSSAATTAATGGSETVETSAGTSASTMSTGSSGPPADGSSSGGGTSTLDACLATCQRLMECGIQEVPNCGIPCASVPAQVAGCADEYVAQQACATALSCDDLQAWTDAMIVPGDHPCDAEDDAFGVCTTGATT